MLRQIQSQIVVFYLALLLCTIGGLTFVQLQHERSAYDAQLEQRLHDDASLVSNLVLLQLTTPAGGDPAAMDDLAKRLGRQIQARITIIDPSGKVLGDSDADPAQMENHLDRPEVQAALHSPQGYGITQRFSHTLQREMTYLAVPIRREQALAGIMRVALPDAEIDAVQQRMVTTALITLLVTLLLTLGPSLLLAAVITKPIQRVTGSARRMAEGDLQQRIAITGPDEVRHLATTFNEMAERIQAMVAELEHERLRLHLILQHLPVGVLLLDAGRQVVLLNPAARGLLQVTTDQEASAALHTIIRPGDLAAAQHATPDRQAQQQTIERTVEGRPQVLGITIRALPIQHGALVVLQDLTLIHHTDLVRREFVANVSHELRTPLASLQLLVEALQAHALDDPTAARHFLAKIDRGVTHLVRLVEDLLLLTRLDAGRLTLHLQPVQLQDAARNALERFGLLAEEHGIRLQSSTAAAVVLADPQRLEQILTNLLSNAIKYTPDGGTIVVETGRSAAHRMGYIRVQDTGIGIAPHEQRRIFERFYQIDPARTPQRRVNGTGTGLGLAIVKHLVQLHDGQIEVTSMPGTGSSFTVLLPLAARPAAQAPT